MVVMIYEKSSQLPDLKLAEIKCVVDGEFCDKSFGGT